MIAYFQPSVTPGRTLAPPWNLVSRAARGNTRQPVQAARVFHAVKTRGQQAKVQQQKPTV